MDTLVLDLQPLELWENESLLFELPHLRCLFCAHSGLIQSGKESEVAFLLAQVVKNPPAMQETWVQSLGWEDPLEKGKATHSSTLAWRIPWREEPGGLLSMGSQRVRHG